MIPWAESASTPSLRGVNIVRTFGDGTSRRAALQHVTLDLFPGHFQLRSQFQLAKEQPQIAAHAPNS